jgi:hypothetical protein
MSGLYLRASRWYFIPNTRSQHSALGMTPFRELSMERKTSNLVAFFRVINLEKLTNLYFRFFPQIGYHISANDLSILA